MGRGMGESPNRLLKLDLMYMYNVQTNCTINRWSNVQIIYFRNVAKYSRFRWSAAVPVSRSFFFFFDMSDRKSRSVS